MITVTVQGLPEIQRQYAALGRDLPKAIAAGINKTAARVIEAEKKAMRENLDRPTPFTLNSMAMYKANPSHRNPAALVFVKPVAAAYLQNPIFGGVYGDDPANPEGALHPGAIKLNRYGNIPKKKSGLEAMAKKQNQFVGAIKTRHGREIYGLFERVKLKRKPKPWRRHHPAAQRPTKPIRVLVYASKSGRTAVMPYYNTAWLEAERFLDLDIQDEILDILRAQGRPIA